ncbi:thioesterase domain-containing protein, partial [Streptomyces sp. NPDC002519]
CPLGVCLTSYVPTRHKIRTLPDQDHTTEATLSLRETFENPAVVRDSIGVTRLAQGTKQPALICFGPFAPVEGSIQFARLSNYFEGLRDVSVVSLPGFHPDEPLASSLNVLVEAASEAVVQCAGEAPFALLGYSSSGWVAHSVASFLTSSGTRPSGLVLLDTYLPDSMSRRFRRAMNYEVIVRRESFATLDYSGLTAIGVYRGLFRNWEPARVDTPTLFVRPTECIPGSPDEPLTGEEWRSAWPLPHVSAEVPGDHCTMIGEYAPHTAETVHRWLTGIPALS